MAIPKPITKGDEKYFIQIDKDDDKEEQGKGNDDTEQHDEGGELWLSMVLSTSSLQSSLSAPLPLMLSTSASVNCLNESFCEVIIIVG